MEGRDINLASTGRACLFPSTTNFHSNFALYQLLFYESSSHAASHYIMSWWLWQPRSHVHHPSAGWTFVPWTGVSKGRGWRGCSDWFQGKRQFELHIKKRKGSEMTVNMQTILSRVSKIGTYRPRVAWSFRIWIPIPSLYVLGEWGPNLEHTQLSTTRGGHRCWEDFLNPMGFHSIRSLHVAATHLLA